MPVAILDALALSAGGFPATFPVSAGADVALVSLQALDGTNAAAPTSVMIGGQSATLVRNADLDTRDVFTSVWGLDKAGIDAMSGSDIVVTGGTFTGSKGFTVSLTGTDLASLVTETYIASTASFTDITQSLSRQAGSLTLAFLTIDDTATVNSSSGPTLSILDNGTSPSVGAGSQTEGTTVTSDFTWNQSLTRDTGVVLINAREVAAATPTITDIDTDESVYPGQSFVITGTNFGATQGSGTVDIDGVTQTVTAWGDTSITCTAVRGGNNYGTGKTLTVTTDAATTATLAVAQEAEPGTFAVTAASPNTADDASLWTGLIDTSTGDPVTVVDGDQAWVKDPNNLGNLSVTPAGEISADTTGDFVVQFWKASEGVWGSDQTVNFTASSGGLTDLELKKKQNKRRRYTANLFGAWRNRFMGDDDE